MAKRQKNFGVGCLVLVVILAAIVLVQQENEKKEAKENEAAALMILTPESAEDGARTVAENTIGKDKIIELEVTENAVNLRIKLSDLSASSARFDANRRFAELACALRDAGLTTQTFHFVGMVDAVDKFGNKSVVEGVEMRLEGDIAAQMNCEDWDLIDLPAIADSYMVYPILE